MGRFDPGRSDRRARPRRELTLFPTPAGSGAAGGGRRARAQQGFHHVRHGPARMGDEGRGIGAPTAAGVVPAAQHREDAVGAGLGHPQALAPLCEGAPGRAGDPQPQITGKQTAVGQAVRLTVDNPDPTLTIGYRDRITGKRAEKSQRVLINSAVFRFGSENFTRSAPTARVTARCWRARSSPQVQAVPASHRGNASGHQKVHVARGRGSARAFAGAAALRDAAVPSAARMQQGHSLREGSRTTGRIRARSAPVPSWRGRSVQVR